MPDRVQPRTLKGFRDYLPDAMATREHLMDVARRVYRSYGYRPIDTPALEYTEILLGKGGEETDKQLYRFDDAGGRDVALRFDLTVPLARFVAQHAHELGTPFKRYHIGPVWRGENTQRGRYREFMQCDFDTVGTESAVADIETGLVIHDVFAALGFERFTIYVNNRKILTGLLEQLDMGGRTSDVLRSIDKLAKVGPERVASELRDSAGATDHQVDQILGFAGLTGDTPQLLARLEALVGSTSAGSDGVAELTRAFEGFRAAGVDQARFALDVAMARGLDYYTGIVYETLLDDLPEIGSCCSGGRYDDLASVYTKQRLPGVGASLGVDRLLAAMAELGVSEVDIAPADVLVTFFEADRGDEYLALGAELRRAGVSAEVFPEPKKLGAQLKYADGRGHKLAVIVGTRELESSTVRIKELATGNEHDVPRVEFTSRIATILG